MSAADPLTAAYQQAERLLDALPETDADPALAAVYSVIRLHLKYIRDLIDQYDAKHPEASDGL